jgi:predicted negative regulator of RcsB-dependent stress response
MKPNLSAQIAKIIIAFVLIVVAILIWKYRQDSLTHALTVP